MVTRAESNVSLRGPEWEGAQRCFYVSGGGLAQRLESAVGQRGPAEVFVQAHSLRDRGEAARPTQKAGGGSMELLETILSLGPTFTLTAFLLCIPQLDACLANGA